MKEKLYIVWRLVKAHIQALLFYMFRIFPINERKIVFTTIEGTTGFSCNPKYVALELIRRNHSLHDTDKYELVWLVDDVSKRFPKGIRKVRNTVLNRAFELTTAAFWIDNSRKQLECRKRSGQIYIQTWHAKLGFKPTCLDRGASFSEIAYLVSKHDSDMVDYWISNSEWYDKTLKNGSLYEGETLRSGSPRCDILVKGRKKAIKRVRERYRLLQEEKILLYCPTFRGGSQGANRQIDQGRHMPDLIKILADLSERFGGSWTVLLRLHPQLTARGIEHNELEENNRIIDVSKADDMYDIMAGCDAFLTDYSSAAFDAAIMGIPVFLYCDDIEEYENERGSLLWDMRCLPFPFASTQEELRTAISRFREKDYLTALKKLFEENRIVEDGHATERVVNMIENLKHSKL